MSTIRLRKLPPRWRFIARRRARTFEAEAQRAYDWVEQEYAPTIEDFKALLRKIEEQEQR